MHVSQFFFPNNFGTVDIMAGGVGGIFNPYKDFRPNPRCKIRFKVHASSAVVKHPALIIPSGRVMFKHDLGFVAETRCLSLVGIGLHLSLSIGLCAQSVPGRIRSPWSIAQSVPIYL